MKKKKDYIQFSASDLSNFSNCNRLTELDKLQIQGKIKKPEWNNPHAQALQERGFQHEENYISALETEGLKIERIPESLPSEESSRLTLEAMKKGLDIIVQGVLKHENWYGKTDILRRTSEASELGNYNYEVLDMKLSRETKGGTILQLCLYSELVSLITGALPKNMYVISPGKPFKKIIYRVEEYQSYYRLVRERLLSAMSIESDTYPEPINHCDVCKWFEICNKKRRSDDHLSFVAGLSSSQRKELSCLQISTLEQLAKTDIDFSQKVKSGTADSFIKIQNQARMQYEARVNGKPSYEILPHQEEKGLNRLPEACDGDIFFDLEGDQFFQESGLEYLWGYSYLESRSLKYEHRWAKNYSEERECFEWFIDYVIERKKTFPNLKIYHYASYEPGALKRLMGRYGAKEAEIDHLLRTGTFVDLHSITRQSLRAGIEKYSIKDLEQFYGYNRTVALKEVGPHKRLIEHSLELNKLENINSDSIEIVRAYNQDDTDSTYYLYQWLEELREQEVRSGAKLTRPIESDGEISIELDEYLQRLIDLKDSLQKNISQNPEERSEIESAQWLLGDLIAFYRREDKVNFWEKFRLKELDSFELLEDKSGISGLTYMDNVGGTAKCPIHRYSFIDQIVDLKKDCPVFKEGFLRDEEAKPFGTVHFINYEEAYIDIKKKAQSADFHPNALWAWNHIDKKNKAERMFELAKYVLENGISDKKSDYKAARDIILRNNPDFKNLVNLDNTDTLELAKEMSLELDNSYLAIQGPPGTGKSYSASRVALSLIKKGFRVGVTGLSHKVISNLMNKIQEASVQENISVDLFQKTKKDEETNENINYIDNKGIHGVLSSTEAFVFGGTDFMWAGEALRNSVDYLLVDEAGQFSLVGIMSIAHATKNIILLGDGAQLKQPIQGSHPDGCETSVLDYVVGDNKTLPKEKGVFLPITYRLHPSICEFNSELFYENRLKAVPGNEHQTVNGSSKFLDSNLVLIEIEHTGNSNHSPEEIDIVKNIVEELINEENTFSLFESGNIKTEKLSKSSIKIIAPYNAQVNRLKQIISEIEIGTVDKFQGQEAPVIIYSVTTSSSEDAPRGMEFLYSGNRLNVAVSRAQCLFIMVASSKVFEPNCKNPRQMQLANAYCRFRELAKIIKVV